MRAGPCLAVLFAQFVAGVNTQDTPQQCPDARGFGKPFNGESRRMPSSYRNYTCGEVREYSNPGTFIKFVSTQAINGSNPITPAAAAVSAIDEAINHGLDVMSTFAGNASHPLEMRMSLMTDTRPWANVHFDDFGLVDAPPEAVLESPCFLYAYVPTNFQNTRSPIDESPTRVLEKLRRDMVDAMYECVMTYHHPNAPPYLWWRNSIAAFLARIAYPATRAMVDPGPDWAPDDFDHIINIYERILTERHNWLFWMFAHTGAAHPWSIAKIHNWMVTKAVAAPDVSEDERHFDTQVFPRKTNDAEVIALFRHEFAQALVLETITYPDGMHVPDFEWWPRTAGGQHWWWEDAPPLQFEVGKERVSAERIDIPVWSVSLYDVTFAGGQTLDVSMSVKNATRWVDEVLWMVRPEEYEGDLHWSYRRVDDKVFTQLPDGATTARIVVPADVPSANYSFVATLTGTSYERANLEWRIERVA